MTKYTKPVLEKSKPENDIIVMCTCSGCTTHTPW
jgi:hypothetical protein